MNKQVWKYLLSHGRNNIKMPKDAEILTAQSQGDDAFIWALVDPSKEVENRVFDTFGTGHNIGYDMGVERKYINTFQMDGGALVFHVFELL